MNGIFFLDFLPLTLFSPFLPKKNVVIGFVTLNRQQSLGLHNLFLKVRKVHGNELQQVWANVLPSLNYYCRTSDIAAIGTIFKSVTQY